MLGVCKSWLEAGPPACHACAAQAPVLLHVHISALTAYYTSFPFMNCVH